MFRLEYLSSGHIGRNHIRRLPQKWAAKSGLIGYIRDAADWHGRVQSYGRLSSQGAPRGYKAAAQQSNHAKSVRTFKSKAFAAAPLSWSRHSLIQWPIPPMKSASFISGCVATLVSVAYSTIRSSTERDDGTYHGDFNSCVR